MENKRWHEPLVCYLVPHESNNFRPKILEAGVIGAILLLVVIIQGAYLIESRIVTKTPDFLAAVLPAVLVTLTNADRATNGLHALAVDPLLVAAAQKKADDMAAKGYFAHVTPEGYQPWHFLELVGYRYEAAGENLAVNFDESEDVSKAWMDSPTHRENILRGQYTHVGIAVARGTYKGREATFVAQFFGRPTPALAAAPAVTPSAPAPAPAPTPVPAETPPVEVAEVESPTAPIAVASPDVVVLGEEAPEAPLIAPAGVIEQLAASPSKVVVPLLVTLAGLIALMFVLAVFAHIKVPHLQALGGTLALLFIVVGLLAYNVTTIAKVEIPLDTQAASVILSQ